MVMKMETVTFEVKIDDDISIKASLPKIVGLKQITPFINTIKGYMKTDTSISSRSPWPKEDDEKLKELYMNSKTTVKEMAEIFNRTEQAIKRRWYTIKEKNNIQYKRKHGA